MDDQRVARETRSCRRERGRRRRTDWVRRHRRATQTRDSGGECPSVERFYRAAGDRLSISASGQVFPRWLVWEGKKTGCAQLNVLEDGKLCRKRAESTSRSLIA